MTKRSAVIIPEVEPWRSEKIGRSFWRRDQRGIALATTASLLSAQFPTEKISNVVQPKRFQPSLRDNLVDADYLFLGGAIATRKSLVPNEDGWEEVLDFMVGRHRDSVPARLALAQNVMVVPISWTDRTNAAIVRGAGQRGLTTLAPDNLHNLQPPQIVSWALDSIEAEPDQASEAS